MPLQNRITPFGDIVSIGQRGMFTGNRGIIHDSENRVLSNRRWTTKAWLVCCCAYKGRRRQVMRERGWTELFFLDEAVALAAGHRPCFLCRRKAAEEFRSAWAIAMGGPPPTAAAMDAILHEERICGRRTEARRPAVALAELPDGVVIAAAGCAFTMAGGKAFCWTEREYDQSTEPTGLVNILTPPSTFGAIMAGYRPAIHPSASRRCSLEGSHER